MDELMRKIFDTAKEHEDRYLLRRRYRKSHPPSDIDLEYEACQRLVDGGFAVWLHGSRFYPGIELTGKPSLNEEAKRIGE